MPRTTVALLHALLCERVSPDQVKAAAATYGDAMPGGKGDKLHPSQVPFDDLVFGVNVEMEHTSDVKRAMEIALDHFAERRDYYKRLDAAGLVDEATRTSFGGHSPVIRRPGFGILRTYHALLARNQAKAQAFDDQADPAGYKLEVRYQAKGAPHLAPGDHETVHKLLGNFNNEVRRRHALISAKHGLNLPVPAPVSLSDIDVTSRGSTLLPGLPQHVHDKLANSADPADRALLGVKWMNPASRALVRDAQRAHQRLAPYHDLLSKTAAAYGGVAQPHPSLPDGYAHDASTQAMPHVEKGVHASVFHFKNKADAWRAMSVLHGTGIKVRDASTKDSKGKEVLNLVEVAAPGAWRDSAGRFSCLSKAGVTEWVPAVPPAIRAAVESLGGKVKRSGAGGGVACVFRTVEEANAAQAKLAEAGHRVSPHDIPGVLLVSFVRPVVEAAEPAVQGEAVVAYHPGTHAALVPRVSIFRKGWDEPPAGISALAHKHGFQAKAHPKGGHVALVPGHVYHAIRGQLGTHSAATFGDHVRIRTPGPVADSVTPDQADALAIEEARLPRRIEGNPNQKDALDYAEQLGASVTHVNRTGEVRVHHPEWDSGVTINSRRKDTPRELIKRLNQLLSRKVDEERQDEDFHMVAADQDEAMAAAQRMADRIGQEVAVIMCLGDDDDTTDECSTDYMILPLEQWLDPDEADPDDYTLVDVCIPGSVGVDEAVARRRSLAARLSADRIRGRPLGGKRLRASLRAKAWRRANPGRTKRKRAHTVYHSGPSLHPLKSHL